jgi:hypothetical protein
MGKHKTVVLAILMLIPAHAFLFFMIFHGDDGSSHIFAIILASGDSEHGSLSKHNSSSL